MSCSLHDKEGGVIYSNAQDELLYVYRHSGTRIQLTVLQQSPWMGENNGTRCAFGVKTNKQGIYMAASALLLVSMVT